MSKFVETVWSSRITTVQNSREYRTLFQIRAEKYNRYIISNLRLISSERVKKLKTIKYDFYVKQNTQIRDTAMCAWKHLLKLQDSSPNVKSFIKYNAQRELNSVNDVELNKTRFNYVNDYFETSIVIILN